MKLSPIADKANVHRINRRVVAVLLAKGRNERRKILLDDVLCEVGKPNSRKSVKAESEAGKPPVLQAGRSEIALFVTHDSEGEALSGGLRGGQCMVNHRKIKDAWRRLHLAPIHPDVHRRGRKLSV